MDKKFSEILLLSGFIWFITSLHYSILPTYFVETSLPDYAYGLSYGLGILFILLTSPIWLNLADEGYRVFILNIAAVMFSMLQITLGYITNIYGVIVVRALSSVIVGAFEIGLFFTVLDIKKEEDNPEILRKYIGYMSIFSLVGFFVGGLLGTILPVREILYIQGILMFIVSILIKIVYDAAYGEDDIIHNGSPRKLKYYFYRAMENKDINNNKLFLFLISVFLLFISYSSFNVNFNYYITKNLGYLPIVNGSIKGFISLSGFFLNMTLSVWIFKNMSIRKTYVLLLGINGVLSFISFKYTGIYFILSTVLYFILYSLILPLVKTNITSENIYTLVDMMVIYNVVKYMGEMIGAVGAGYLYLLDPKLPFLFGMVSITLAFLIIVTNKIKVLN